MITGADLTDRDKSARLVEPTYGANKAPLREGCRIEFNAMSDTANLLRDTRALKLRGEEGGSLTVVGSELLTAGTSVRIDDCYYSAMIRIRCSEGPYEGRYLIECAALGALEDQPRSGA